MSQDAFKTMVLRNEYYRDGFRKLILVLIAALVALIASLGALYYQVTHLSPDTLPLHPMG